MQESPRTLPSMAGAPRVHSWDHVVLQSVASLWKKTEGNFMWFLQPLWIQGSAALNALRVQFGGTLYLLRRYDWIHRDPGPIQRKKTSHPSWSTSRWKKFPRVFNSHIPKWDPRTQCCSRHSVATVCEDLERWRVPWWNEILLMEEIL